MSATRPHDSRDRIRGAIPSRSCGARSEVITSRRPAVMISFIVWKNSSWVESLPAMNWTSSISSRSAERSRPLKPIVSFSRIARTNSTMNFSADIETTRPPRILGQEHLADGVEQMGLAAPGAAMDEQGVEVDAFRATRASWRRSRRLHWPCRRRTCRNYSAGRTAAPTDRARPVAPAPPEFPRGSAKAPGAAHRPRRRSARR